MNPKVKLYLIVWVPWAIMVSIVSYLIYFNFSYEALAKLLSVKGSYNETVLSPSVYMNFSDDPPINSSLVELIGGREFETMEMPEEDFNLPPGIAAGFISGQMAGQRAPAPDAPNAGWVTDAETAGTNRGSNSSGTVPMPGLVAPVTPHSGAQIERTASSAKFESQEKMEDNVHMPKLVNPFGPLQNFGHKFSFPTNKENSSTTKPTGVAAANDQSPDKSNFDQLVTFFSSP